MVQSRVTWVKVGPYLQLRVPWPGPTTCAQRFTSRWASCIAVGIGHCTRVHSSQMADVCYSATADQLCTAVHCQLCIVMHNWPTNLQSKGHRRGVLWDFSERKTKGEIPGIIRDLWGIKMSN